MEKGGRFVLSDDSHGVGQVGLNYHRLFKYIQALSLSCYYRIDVDADGAVFVQESSSNQI
jgi:histidinol-phosphatase (PHP family)